MQKIRQIFLRGFLTLLPIAVSIYIIYTGFFILENLLGSFLRALLPERTYVPGFGFFLTLILIFAFGFTLNHLISVSIWAQIEKLLTQVPLIKAVYSPLRDLMNLFSKGQKDLKSVALIEIQPGIKALGLITRDHFRDLPSAEEQLKGHMAVYIPLSYALGGYTLLVDKKKIQEIDIPVEKALSYAITAWVKTPHEESDRHGQ